MPASAQRVDGWIVRAALLAFPRRFRSSLAKDLLALYEDFEAAGRRRSRVSMSWDLLRNGLAARGDDARRSLGGDVGDSPPASEGPRSLGSLFGDFVFGVRLLRKSPVFTIIAVGSLAVGIGANTAVFTVLDATILRALPVLNPEELVVLHMAGEYEQWPDISQSGWMLTNDQGHSEASSFSYPMYERLRDADTPFREVTAFAQLYRINVRVQGGAELASGQVVAGNYYSFLGIRPFRGRLLNDSDDEASAVPVAVISHDYWQTRFGGLDEAVGSEIHVNGTAFAVVGITPPGFGGALQLGSAPAVSLPLAHQAPVMRQRELLARGDYWWLYVMGRLSAGATIEQAQEAAGLSFARSLEADLDLTDSELYITALPGGRGMTEARSLIVRPLTTVAIVVVAVLLIACVNLANLLVARASTRSREIAVRLSLGASRWRVTRQLLSESLLLACVGAGLGTILAFGMRDLLLPVLDLQGTRLGLALNWRVLVFTGLAAGLTGLIFGIVPALRATRVDLTPALKDEPLRGGTSRFGLARILLIAQVALSLGLLIVAGLFAGSFAALTGEATGFDGANVLTLSIDPRTSGYEGQELTTYYTEAVVRLRGVPGVVAAGMASHVPASGSMTGSTMRVEGYEPAEDERISAFVNVVDAGFFDVFDIVARQGRLFETSDDAGSAPVAVVNQHLVDRYLPGTNPLGRHVGFGREESAIELEIVGVVDDIKYQNLSDDPRPAVHILYTQVPRGPGGQTIALAAASRPEDLAAGARAALRELDADVSIRQLDTHTEVLRRNVVVARTFAQLSVGLSAVAMLLSCIGLYGILSYSVTHRRREIGVRMALGARRGDVVGLVMREMRTVVGGGAIGLLGSYFAVRGLESQLYGLDPTNPVVMLGAALVLLTVAAVAAFLPAWQASLLDPVEALHNE